MNTGPILIINDDLDDQEFLKKHGKSWNLQIN